MAAAPAISAANNMISPPTDAQTLTMFEPLDERTAEIDDFLKNNPLALSLRADGGFRESRPHLKIPKDLRSHNLLAGTLTGPGMFWVPPLAFADGEGKAMTIIYYIGDNLCGHKGIIHGGTFAMMLDEGLARCCFPALPNKIAMTASLNVSYKAPGKADSYVVLKATTTKVEGRKAWVEGRIETLPQEGEEPVVLVQAEALFIEPKQAAVSLFPELWKRLNEVH
ncbi:hypothetical protein MMC20_003564 [Loxospora ochrophaea]|nr:hypothetical protein [Loxospora ochrophaea]